MYTSGSSPVLCSGHIWGLCGARRVTPEAALNCGSIIHKSTRWNWTASSVAWHWPCGRHWSVPKLTASACSTVLRQFSGSHIGVWRTQESEAIHHFSQCSCACVCYFAGDQCCLMWICVVWFDLIFTIKVPCHNSRINHRYYRLYKQDCVTVMQYFKVDIKSIAHCSDLPFVAVLTTILCHLCCKKKVKIVLLDWNFCLFIPRAFISNDLIYTIDIVFCLLICTCNYTELGTKPHFCVKSAIVKSSYGHCLQNSWATGSVLMCFCLEIVWNN